MDNNKKEPSFQITLNQFLDLCDIWNEQTKILPASCTTLAEIIEALAVGKERIHIQWVEHERKTRAVLWEYKWWKESSEKWEKDKAKSESERRERFIYQANMENVVKALKKDPFNIIGDRAIETAHSFIKKRQIKKLEYIGVKLIERFEDIP